MLLVVAFAFCADKPWKDKDPDDWTAEDVRRILENSPWSQIAMVDARWVGFAERESKVTYRAKVGTVKTQPEYDPPNASTQAFEDKAIFWVLWTSSRTVQRALARVTYPGAKVTDPAAIRKAADPEYYLLAVFGDDMRPFDRVDEAYLLKTTWLRADSRKPRLQPERVEKRFSPRGTNLAVVLFYFSRESAGKAGWNPAQQKQLEFQCEGQDAVIRVKFRPGEMVGPAGKDLQ